MDEIGTTQKLEQELASAVDEVAAQLTSGSSGESTNLKKQALSDPTALDVQVTVSIGLAVSSVWSSDS